MRIMTLAVLAMTASLLSGVTTDTGAAQPYDPSPPIDGLDYGPPPPPPPPRFGLFGPRFGYGPRPEPLARFCATDAGTCTMSRLQPIASPCRCVIDGRRISGEAVH